MTSNTLPGIAEGTVKWFNDEKGFGFVRCDELDRDVFVHYSNVMMDGHKTLEPGQTVRFKPVVSDKGTAGQDVEVI